MISRFFKKKKPTSTPARKMIKEAKEVKTKNPPQKVLTAEGWKHMMMRTRKGKKPTS